MSNKIIAIVGGQWGDEGKGKVVDWAASYFDISARATGGNNAGHTIYIGDEKHVFHLIPSAITWENVDCFLGNGMVIDLFVLQKEIDLLKKKGFRLNNLNISGRAHVILLYHLFIDEYQENSKGDRKIGTTKTGIGPSYSDKYNRNGIRINDLLDRDILYYKIYSNFCEKLILLKTIYSDEEILAKIKELLLKNISSKYFLNQIDKINLLDIQLLTNLFTEIYHEMGLKLRSNIVDTSDKISCAIKNNKNVLLEGAQGLLLDIDHGSYPFVTSSNPSVGGLHSGLGIPKIDETYSVIKAYVTRVGSGPFPTELTDEVGDYIRNKGQEFGSTTGRPRRCGWQDALLLRFTSKINGQKIILTRLDILSGISKLKICNSYKYSGPKRYFNGEIYFKGKIITEFPADAGILEYCIPHDLIEIDGWNEDISKIRDYDLLPNNAKKYISCLENFGNVKVSLIGVGPKRDEIIIRPGEWNLEKKSNKYSAIIYDMDNTLVATNSYVAALIKSTIMLYKDQYKFEIPFDKKIELVLKENLPFEEIFVKLFPNPLGYTGDEPLSKLLLAKYRERAKLIPFSSTLNGSKTVNELFKKGIIQGITTNRVIMAEERLKQAGYNNFDFIIAPEKSEDKKPSPKIIFDALEILKLKNIPASKVLCIGDHTDDYLSSKTAGVDFIAVLTGFVSEEEFISVGLNKDRIIKNLGDLDKILNN